MTPTLTFIVPTHREDRPLERCLNSLVWQLGRHDEVLVVGDTFDGALPMVEHLVTTKYDARFHYLALNAGHHCWGHEQINYALERAYGDWIHVNDDDDVWTPDAVRTMREAADEADGKPLLFRFVSYVGMPFWVERGRLERGWVGGHCMLAPNDRLLGRWACAYSGDYDYIEQTVMAHGGPGEAVWRDEFVAVARPQSAARLPLVVP